MTKSLADRMQLCKDRYNDIPQCLIDEARAMEDQLMQMHEGLTLAEAELAEYKYTPQAYDEMWDRVKEVVNENDELKAQLEISVNNLETDSN